MDNIFHGDNICLFIGPPESGKSTSIRYIAKYYIKEERYHYVIVICSVGYKDNYLKWLPEEFIHTNYTDKIIDNIKKKQIELKEIYPDIRALIIFDDISTYETKFARNKNLEALFTEHRHFQCDIFVGMHSPTAILNDRILNSVTHSFLYYTNSDKAYKEMYMYYNTGLERWKDLKRLIQSNTDDHYVILYIKKNRKSPFVKFKHPKPKPFFFHYG